MTTKKFKKNKYLWYFLSLLLVVATILQVVAVKAQTTRTVGSFDGATLLPTGQFVTPTVAPGSTFSPLSTGLRSDNNADAAQAVTTALSPDRKTLLVLTSGYNLNFKNEKTGENITYSVLDPKLDFIHRF